MEYLEFERILSAKRIQRYKDAANGDTRKAMALYRYNLRLSQEMFTIVSCFEVALRNAIDSLLVPSLGEKLTTVTHEYPDFSITMTAFLCTPKAEANGFKRKEHADSKWCCKEELQGLDWAAADVGVVSALLVS